MGLLFTVLAGDMYRTGARCRLKALYRALFHDAICRPVRTPIPLVSPSSGVLAFWRFKSQGRLALATHIRTSALPQEIPAPKAHISTGSPGLIRPSRNASSKAIGIEALDVLP
jgi:hypothetical protein